MIDIKPFDKAEVLKALYDAASADGSNLLGWENPEMTIERAKELVARHKKNKNLYFDYVDNKYLKVDLYEGEFNPAKYDREYGEGAAKLVIGELIAKKGIKGIVPPDRKEEIEGIRVLILGGPFHGQSPEIASDKLKGEVITLKNPSDWGDKRFLTHNISPLANLDDNSIGFILSYGIPKYELPSVLDKFMDGDTNYFGSVTDKERDLKSRKKSFVVEILNVCKRHKMSIGVTNEESLTVHNELNAYWFSELIGDLELSNDEVRDLMVSVFSGELV